MTQEKQRIIIAEACGLENVRMHYGSCEDARLPDVLIYGQHYRVPDYLTDLNAMRGAIKTLSSELQITFAKQLTIIVSKVPFVGTYWAEFQWPELFAIMSATAEQYAEAFLRTIGKWEY